MQSTIQEVLQFYRNVINRPQVLANGYQIIKEFLFRHHKNRGNTLLNLLHPHAPILQLVINIYPNEVFNNTGITIQQKRQTIEFLLNLLTSEILKAQSITKNKHISLLFQFLYKIHNIQGYKDWVPFYQKSLELLISNKSINLGYFLLNILKDADDRVHELTRYLLKLVMTENSMFQIQQKLTIIYYCFKSMAFLYETDPDTIQAFVSPFIQLSIGFVKENMNKSVKSMKYGLKIMTVLFADYEIQCNKQLLQLIQTTTQQLISEYLIFLNKNNKVNQQNFTLDDEQDDDSQPIQVALYQMLELFMTLHEMNNQINYQLVIYLCIVSTFISECQYKAYIANSDQYFIEIQDEGEMNARNKSIYFLQTILTGKSNNKYNTNCKKMLKEYVSIVLNLNNDKMILNKYLEKYHLPLTVLNLNQIYIESTLFVIYSFSDILIQNEKQMGRLLGLIIANGHPKSIDTILALLILNPLIKKQDNKDKQHFIIFINSNLYKFNANIGMQLSLMRSIYNCYPVQYLQVSANNNNNVPIFFIQQLLLYILKNDSYQNETGYLIIDFLVHLFKNDKNLHILPALINYPIQIQLFKKYIHDGMTSSVLIKLLSHLKNQQLIKQICCLLMNGHVRDKHISSLIITGMTNHMISYNEKEIIGLLNIYQKSIEIVEDVVAIFLQNCHIADQNLIILLNKHCNSKWIHLLIKQNRFINLQQHFLNIVKKIIYQITSLCELENQLLLPYLLLVNGFNQAIHILIQNQLFDPFFDKLLNYGKLFKGSNLKMITIIIFTELATLNTILIPKVLGLNQAYGSMEENQWQQQQIDGENQEDMLGKILQNIQNSEVEELFLKAFGQLCFSNSQIQSKIQYLKTLR